MPISFKIEYMDPFLPMNPESSTTPDPNLPQEPFGKWIAANSQQVGAGYQMRFEHDPGWIFRDYRVFQVIPNEDKAFAVATGVKKTNPGPQPPNRPPVGQLEVLQPNPVNGPEKWNCAIHTKRKIMSQFHQLNSVHLDYYAWPNPEPDSVANPNPVRYHNPNQTNESTFRIWRVPGLQNTVTIMNRQNRGYLRGGIAPVFDIILRFEDNAGNQYLVDPPIRNER